MGNRPSAEQQLMRRPEVLRNESPPWRQNLNALASKEGRIRREGSLEEVTLMGLARWVGRHRCNRKGTKPGQRPYEGMSLGLWVGER